MSTEDEEALAWAGDNDERLTVGSTSKSPVRKRRASPSPSRHGKSEIPLPSASPDVPATLSSGGVIALGILGGIYLLFSAGWIVTAVRNPIQIADPLGSFMFILGLWLAVLAPAAWFAATLVFGRPRSFRWRLLSLVLGAALVIPWPYFIRGA